MWQRRPAADWSLDIFAVLKINPEGIAIIQPSNGVDFGNFFLIFFNFCLARAKGAGRSGL
jgi:hypothetical protein